MNKIKAIETVYNGYRFRSRLEARVAIFFDELGIKYLYEPEGFDLGDGIYYLPDFYLPGMDTWVEVKGVMSDSDMNKTNAMLKNKQKMVVVYSDLTFQTTVIDAYEEYILEHKSESVLFRCANCGKWYFTSNICDWSCRCCNYHDGDNTFDDYCFGDYDKDRHSCSLDVLASRDKARQARFEHGEKPIITQKYNYCNHLHSKSKDDSYNSIKPADWSIKDIWNDPFVGPEPDSAEEILPPEPKPPMEIPEDIADDIPMDIDFTTDYENAVISDDNLPDIPFLEDGEFSYVPPPEYEDF